MKGQSEFEAVGTVSIWIGNFLTDSQFDDYMNLSKKFEGDFGFQIDNCSVREGVVEKTPAPVEDLAKGFSNWESFAPAVGQAARDAGVKSATTMIVFYCVQFDPTKVKVNANAPLKYIGAFPFS